MRNDSPTSLEQYYQAVWGAGEPTQWQRARQASDQLNKTAISLSHLESRLMSFLIAQNRCRKFIEIGTLTGASALWILQALPADGKLWTLEKDPAHAAAARQVLADDARAIVIEGDARETLKLLVDQGPFDGIFIDGNKAAYGDYLTWAEENLSPGGLVLADNVFLGGAVLMEQDGVKLMPLRFSDKQVQIMREFNSRLANPTHYRSALIPTSEGLIAAVRL